MKFIRNSCYKKLFHGDCKTTQIFLLSNNNTLATGQIVQIVHEIFHAFILRDAGTVTGIVHCFVGIQKLRGALQFFARFYFGVVKAADEIVEWLLA